MVMNVPEIRAALARRGWTQRELAQRLCIHPVTLSLILSGKNKLTDQLASHIDLVFNDDSDKVLMCRVTLPDFVCDCWQPGWESLDDAQRVSALGSVLKAVAGQLSKADAAALAPDVVQVLRGLVEPKADEEEERRLYAAEE